MRSPIFKLTALAAIFLTGLAGAETVATQHLPTVEVKARAVSPTNRITLKQMDETTDTELKEVNLRLCIFAAWDKIPLT